MELNKRGRGDPWSLRQCGIYQQIGLIDGRSRWIFLQLSKAMRTKLEQNLKLGSTKTGGINAIIPHIICISDMAVNWQSYLEYLNTQLAALVRIEQIQLLEAY